MSNDCIDYITQFINSKPFVSYGKINPRSSNEIKRFILDFYECNKNLIGIEIIYKRLADNTKGSNPPKLKWFNYLSQIRCIHYLIEKRIPVVAVEVLKGNKQLDFQLRDGRYGEIKSFSTIDGRTDKPYSLDECVLQTFVKNKVRPVFEIRGADLLIVDNIFSHFSKQYGLLDYFLSFSSQPEIKDRYNLIQKHLGTYLSKMLYLSFTKSITIDPTIQYRGEEFVKLNL